MFLDKTPGRTCIAGGRDYLFFSGYSYLGMNYVEPFISYIKEGINKYGMLFPSSRNSNTRLPLFDQMEDALSRLTSMEETVIFSSGYLAGQSIAALLTLNANIHIAPGTHPSVHIPGSKIYVGSFTEWSEQLIIQINKSAEPEWLLVADSINILEGIVHDFTFVKGLPPGKRIIFLIDDSHGIGILGEKGEGIISMLPQQANVEYILSYSLSKAFNIAGGAVSASSRWCSQLRGHPNYAGSTSISPAQSYAFLQSTELYLIQKSILENNISEFIQIINTERPRIPLPIFICKNENAGDLFLKNGIIISSFAYPFPNSKITNRVIINSLHTRGDIEQMALIWKLLK